MRVCCGNDVSVHRPLLPDLSISLDSRFVAGGVGSSGGEELVDEQVAEFVAFSEGGLERVQDIDHGFVTVDLRIFSQVGTSLWAEVCHVMSPGIEFFTSLLLNPPGVFASRDARRNAHVRAVDYLDGRLTVSFCTDIPLAGPAHKSGDRWGRSCEFCGENSRCRDPRIGHTCDAYRLGHDGIRGRHRWPRLSIHRDRNDLNLRHHVPASRPAVGSGGQFSFVE